MHARPSYAYSEPEEKIGVAFLFPKIGPIWFAIQAPWITFNLFIYTLSSNSVTTIESGK